LNVHLWFLKYFSIAFASNEISSKSTSRTSLEAHKSDRDLWEWMERNFEEVANRWVKFVHFDDLW
jgi:hypothetical protein